MPVYTYTGDEGRYYTTLGLSPEPSGEYELECNPGDGRWTPDDPGPDPLPEIEAPPAAPAPWTRKSPVPDTTTTPEPAPGLALTEGGA